MAAKAIVAKFLCTSVDDKVEYETVYFTAVYSADPNSENYSWSQASPAGSLQLSISNPAARGVFQQGKQYILTFDEAGS